VVQGAEEFGHLVVGGVPVLGEPVVFGEPVEAFGGAGEVAAGVGEGLGQGAPLRFRGGGRRGDGGFEAGAVGLHPVVAAEEVVVGLFGRCGGSGAGCRIGAAICRGHPLGHRSIWNVGRLGQFAVNRSDADTRGGADRADAHACRTQRLDRLGAFLLRQSETCRAELGVHVAVPGLVTEGGPRAGGVGLLDQEPGSFDGDLDSVGEGARLLFGRQGDVVHAILLSVGGNVVAWA
jgi:hypothetical protein